MQPLGIMIRSFQGLEGLEAIREAWEEITAGMGCKHFFHLWEWHYSYLKWLETDPAAVHFFLFSDNRGPLAVIPLRSTQISLGGVKLKAFSFPSHDHLSLCDLIAREEMLERPLLRFLQEELRDRGEAWDVILLRHLLADSAAGKVARHSGALYLPRPDGGCDIIDLDGTYRNYIAGLSKNFRRSLKRAEQSLEELTDVRVCFIGGGRELEEAFRNFTEVEASGWKGGGGTGTAIALQPGLASFYREVAQLFAALGKVSVNTLAVDGKCVAAQFCLSMDDRVYILKIGYDEAYKRQAPGKHLMDLFIRRCMADGAVAGINLVTDAAWHADWNPRTVPKEDLILFNSTPRGLFAYGLLRGHATLRRLYGEYLKPHLPSRLREELGGHSLRLLP